ncbi:22640_t:CDS:1, partial [Gigaspora margarita]
VRGEIYKMMGKYHEAYNDLERSLEIRPDFAHTALNFTIVKRIINSHNESKGNIKLIGYNDFQNIRHLDVGGFGEIFEATYVSLLGEKGKFALKYLKSSKGYSIDIVDE